MLILQRNLKTVPTKVTHVIGNSINVTNAMQSSTINVHWTVRFCSLKLRSKLQKCD